MMMQRMRYHARTLLMAGALIVAGLPAATPAQALDDCNKFENMFERSVCFVASEVELMFQWFDTANF